MDFIIIVKPRGQIPDIPLGKKRSLKAKHMLCQTASCDEGELQLQLRKNRLPDPCKEDLESVGKPYDSQDLRNPADDVMATIQYAKKFPNSKNYTASMQKIEAVDPLMVRITTFAPNPNLLNDLAYYFNFISTIWTILGLPTCI